MTISEKMKDNSETIRKIWLNSGCCPSCGADMASESNSDLVMFDREDTFIFKEFQKCHQCWEDDVNKNIEVSE